MYIYYVYIYYAYVYICIYVLNLPLWQFFDLFIHIL